METLYKIFDYVIIGGTIQGLFLALVVLNAKKGDKRANQLLAALLFLFAFSIAHRYITHELMSMSPSRFKKTAEPFILLIGPMFYFYLEELLFKSFKHTFKLFLHLLPFWAYFGFLLLERYALSPETIAVVRFPYFNRLMWLAIVIHLGGYMYANYKMVNQYEQGLKNCYSSLDRIRLSWARYFIWVMVIANTLFFLLFWAEVHGHPMLFISKAIPVILSLIVYWLGYRALLQPRIYLEARREAEKITREEGKYKKSSLKKEDSDKMFEQLRRLMETGEVYTDPDLTLPLLAEQLNWSTNTLSRVINDSGQQNFYDFINNYRIKKVLADLQDSSKNRLSILDISFNAGFNSKATFNKVFKQKTGTTPNQARKIQD